VPYKLTSDDTYAKFIARMRERCRDFTPVAQQVGAAIRRVAARNAPRGQRRGRGSLARSLNVAVQDGTTIVLQSPLAYAGVTQRGGIVRAGGGPLHARNLVIPLSGEAEKILDSLGVSTSLRDAGYEMWIYESPNKQRRFLVRFISTDKNTVFGDERRKKKFNKQGKLVRAISRRGEIEFLFLLVPQVDIPAQPYAPHLSDPEVRTVAARALRQHLRKG